MTEPNVLGRRLRDPSGDPAGAPLAAVVAFLGVLSVALAAVGCGAPDRTEDPGSLIDPPVAGDDDDDADVPRQPSALLGAPGTRRPDAPPVLLARTPPPGMRFVDVTAEWGITHSQQRDPDDGRPLMASGACAIDVDGVPPLDLFFTRLARDGGATLWVGAGYGNYIDETAARGLAGRTGDAVGCLALDVEGDGDQDLLAYGYGTVELFLNDGGAFEPVPDEALRHEAPGQSLFTSAAAGDVDGDGDLDIAIVGYVDWDVTNPNLPVDLDEICYRGVPCRFEPSVHPNAPNLLLIQQDDGSFEDLEIQIKADRLSRPEMPMACRDVDRPNGIPGCPWGMRLFFDGFPTLAVGIRDFDQDGVVDVFVGNDYYVTDRVFHRVSATSWAEVGAQLSLSWDWQGGGLDTMGFASGDIDGDLILDHVRTNFEGRASAVHVSRGRIDVYEDESPTIGMRDRDMTFRWAPGFVDHDLDGDLDLFEATGHYYREEYFETRGYEGPEAQPTNIFENDGSGRLVAIDPMPGDGLGLATDSRSLNFADLDDDGRPEIILGNVEGPPTILKSLAATTGHWLRVDLVGAGPNREAALAHVEVTQPGDQPGQERTYLRVKKLGEGYGGSGDPRLHFGLPRPNPVSVEVRWPDGSTTVVFGVAVDSEIRIVQ